jgi:hypothetical protein
MKFVCGDSNLCPKPKLSAVRKLGRGIMHEDCTFAVLKKILDGLIVIGQTTFRMAAGILINMIDRFFNTFNDFYG